MVRINSIPLSLVLMGLFSGSFGATAPTVIQLENNESASVVLSDTNINRILVVNDEITHLTCPQNLCAAEHHSSDTSGAFYVNLMTQSPFTVFVSTNSGRHFSLQITPEALAGQTLMINPVGGSEQARSWEVSSYYQSLLCGVMEDMMKGWVPQGYGYFSLQKNKPTHFKNLASLQGEGLWVGGKIEGVKYLISNQEKTPLTLPESAFYHHGVRAVALTEQTIPPGGEAYLYEVISKPEKEGGDAHGE